MAIDIKGMTNEELQNSIENYEAWALQKETFAHFWGKGSHQGMCCISQAGYYRSVVQKIKQEINERNTNKL